MSNRTSGTSRAGEDGTPLPIRLGTSRANSGQSLISSTATNAPTDQATGFTAINAPANGPVSLTTVIDPTVNGRAGRFAVVRGPIANGTDNSPVGGVEPYVNSFTPINRRDVRGQNLGIKRKREDSPEETASAKSSSSSSSGASMSVDDNHDADGDNDMLLNAPGLTDIIKAAEKLMKPSGKTLSGDDDDDADYWPVGGQTRGRKRQRPIPRPLKLGLPASTPIDPMPVNQPTPATPPNSGHPRSCVHKFFAHYPFRNDPLPATWTLHDLVRNYPNHLIGENLIPFLQHRWNAGQIMALLPDQSSEPEERRVTRTVLASRLIRVRERLQTDGTLHVVMFGPKRREIGQ